MLAWWTFFDDVLPRAAVVENMQGNWKNLHCSRCGDWLL